jgi:hypothetical protein
LKNDVERYNDYVNDQDRIELSRYIDLRAANELERKSIDWRTLKSYEHTIDRKSYQPGIPPFPTLVHAYAGTVGSLPFYSATPPHHHIDTQTANDYVMLERLDTSGMSKVERILVAMVSKMNSTRHVIDADLCWLPMVGEVNAGHELPSTSYIQYADGLNTDASNSTHTQDGVSRQTVEFLAEDKTIHVRLCRRHYILYLRRQTLVHLPDGVDCDCFVTDMWKDNPRAPWVDEWLDDWSTDSDYDDD